MRQFINNIMNFYSKISS